MGAIFWLAGRFAIQIPREFAEILAVGVSSQFVRIEKQYALFIDDQIKSPLSFWDGYENSAAQ